jgi:hypothetical protein
VCVCVCVCVCVLFLCFCLCVHRYDQLFKKAGLDRLEQTGRMLHELARDSDEVSSAEKGEDDLVGTEQV